MKILILIILSSFIVSAKHIEISNTDSIEVERSHQFQSHLIMDDGTHKDITNNTDFSISGENQTSPGNFYFSIPMSNQGYEITKILTATYTDSDNNVFHTKEVISINTNPSYVQINGPFYVFSGQTHHFTAYGMFNGRLINITNQGHWRANRGIAFGAGVYRAPLLQQPVPIQDSIYFQFGTASAWKTVTVRKSF